MKALRAELRRNFDAFSIQMPRTYASACSVLANETEQFFASYLRLSTLQAWRAFVLERVLTADALSFYTEAQNDALLSHALARIGAWRSALQSLRSFLENALFCLYYKDHPVEYQLWERGKHSLPISGFISYIGGHPAFEGRSAQVTGVPLLSSEYSTLSRAVHGSSKAFRMTDDKQFPMLFRAERPLLGKWAAREKRVLHVVNLLFLCAFSTELQGSRLRDLRKSLSLVIPQRHHTAIHTELGIRLFIG